MNLKELTWENHKNAERREFAKILMSGEIPTRLYYQYLLNQHSMYSVLEEALKDIGFKKSLHRVFRADLISEDLTELEYTYSFRPAQKDILPVAHAYHKHIEGIKDNPDALIAHMYVRHFGDMYGGAMIQKKIPGSGSMYDFEDKDELKTELRELLNNAMAAEANLCFKFAIQLFEELENVRMGSPG